MGATTIKSRSVLKIPPDTMTPYNAQATLFFEAGFWSLYLPITVVGRVSDIWRSYFAQALFKRIGVELGFLPRPVVVQDRNPHSYLADFDAEIPLYEKSSVLVSYLLNNYVRNDTLSTESFIEILENLWIDLYEREYIEIEDVKNMQLWIKTLIKIGYQFPKITSTSNSSSTPLKSHEIIRSSVSKILEERTRLSQIGHSINSQEPIEIRGTQKQYCTFEKQMVFGSSDLNDATRADISLILANISQLFIHVGPRKMSEKYSKILQPFPQAQYFDQNVSYPLNAYLNAYTKIDSSWPSKNARWYKDQNVGKVEAFICTYPAAMCQLWIPMNKSVIFLPAHRYNLGKCSASEWKKLDEDITILNNESAEKGHVIGALSRYDVEYLKYYTGVQADLVPSYSGFYIDSNSYKPDQKQFAIISPNSTHFHDKITNLLAPEFSFVALSEMTNSLSTKELGKYPAVILFPSNVVSYTTTELYALSIPIFVPSIKFYLNYHDVRNCSSSDEICANLRTSQGFKDEHFGFSLSRISTSFPYCSSDQDVEKEMRPGDNELKSIHPYSPNIDMSEDAESESYWLQFADFYEWPHIQYFDSYYHLKKLLRDTNFDSIHTSMRKELVIRKDKVMNQWCKIVQSIK